MACFPPVRPSVVPGPSGSHLLAAFTAPFRNGEASPLLHFDATLSVFFLRLPQPPMSHVDHGPTGIVPRISSLPFSISGCRCPSFHSQVLWKRRGNFALLPRSLTLGFGYPFGEMAWLPHPWRSFSISNALGLRPSELFSFQVIE